MDANALRALQGPLKESYKQEPAAALVTLKAQGRVDEAKIACKVETGRALAVAGLHPATGGTGAELCSGDMLLEALVACAGVTLKAVATALEIPLRDAVVRAEGDLDFRGTLGVDRTAPVGFRAIRLMIDLDTDAPQDKIDALLKLTERYCVVFQTLNTKPALSVATTRRLAADHVERQHEQAQRLLVRGGEVHVHALPVAGQRRARHERRVPAEKHERVHGELVLKRRPLVLPVARRSLGRETSPADRGRCLRRRSRSSALTAAGTSMPYITGGRPAPSLAVLKMSTALSIKTPSGGISPSSAPMRESIEAQSTAPRAPPSGATRRHRARRRRRPGAGTCGASNSSR